MVKDGFILNYDYRFHVWEAFRLKEDGVLTRTEVDENLEVLFEKCRKRGFKLYGVARKGIDHLYEWLTKDGIVMNYLKETYPSYIHPGHVTSVRLSTMGSRLPHENE